MNNEHETSRERFNRERAEREERRRNCAADYAYDAWRQGKDPDEAYDRALDSEECDC